MSYQINHMSHNYESLRRNRKNTEAANEKKITSRFQETDLFWFLFKGISQHSLMGRLLTDGLEVHQVHADYDWPIGLVLFGLDTLDQLDIQH